MDVGIRSVYSNYDDFRRPAEDAMKLSIACFSNFEYNFPLARSNDYNFSR